MHLVHRNRRYNDMNEAKKHRDGLVVLGVFFQVNQIKLFLFKISIKYLDNLQISSIHFRIKSGIFLDKNIIFPP